jgi:hypothetical protein
VCATWWSLDIRMQPWMLTLFVLTLTFGGGLSVKSRSKIYASDSHNKVVYSVDGSQQNNLRNLTASQMLKNSYLWISWFKFHQTDFRPYSPNYDGLPVSFNLINLFVFLCYHQ